jgi:dihydropteroate synthase
MIWQTTRFQIDLTQPKVMGIVNITPDSFSDGGKFFTPGSGMASALVHCERLVNDGADILDIGGESSRPGAQPLPLADELARVIPVLRHALSLGVAVSVDTYKSEVMKVVLDLGADIINDIWALRQPRALEVVSKHASCGVCLMHMHLEPQTMQAEPMRGDVVAQVLIFLQRQAKMLDALGVAKNRITLDPGIGFGKTLAQNFALLARQQDLLSIGYPLLAGWSRKSSLAAVSSTSLELAAQMDIADRMVPSVVAAVLAVERGARVVRVHDVRETVQALKVWTASKIADQ